LIIFGSFGVYRKIRFVWKLFVFLIISSRTYVVHIKGSSHTSHEKRLSNFLLEKCTVPKFNQTS
jgi:hypothetical protein